MTLVSVEVDDRSTRIADDVRGDERVAGDSEHARVTLRLGFLRQDLVHLIDGCRSRGDERQVGDRTDGDRRPNGDAVEPARVFGQRARRGQRGAGGGRNQVRGRRPAAR